MKILLVPLIVGFRFLVHLIVSFRFPSLFRNLFFIYGKSENRPNYTVVLFIFIQPNHSLPRANYPTPCTGTYSSTYRRGSKILCCRKTSSSSVLLYCTCSSTGTKLFILTAQLLITVTCANVLLTFSYFHWILMSIIYQ